MKRLIHWIGHGDPLHVGLAAGLLVLILGIVGGAVACGLDSTCDLLP